MSTLKNWKGVLIGQESSSEHTVILSGSLNGQVFKDRRDDKTHLSLVRPCLVSLLSLRRETVFVETCFRLRRLLEQLIWKSPWSMVWRSLDLQPLVPERLVLHQTPRHSWRVFDSAIVTAVTSDVVVKICQKLNICKVAFGRYMSIVNEVPTLVEMDLCHGPYTERIPSHQESWDNLETKGCCDSALGKYPIKFNKPNCHYICWNRENPFSPSVWQWTLEYQPLQDRLHVQ